MKKLKEIKKVSANERCFKFLALNFKLSFLIFSLSLVFVFATLAFTVTTAEAQDYTLLAPLPNTGIGSNIPLSEGGLAKYLQSLFDLSLGIIIALAVVMIVIGGAQYLSTDAVFGMEEGKKKLWNALQGLVIALGTVIILNTINPGLLKLNLDLGKLKQPEKTTIVALDGGRRHENLPGGLRGSCVGCSVLTRVPMKANLCGQKTCYVSMRMLEKLENLTVNAISLSWQVAEAYPPTVEHKNPCHYNGTCVDANFIGASTPETIVTFINAAKNSSIKAVYEVESDARKQELIKAGVPSGNVLSLPPINGKRQITAEHFSLY